MCDTEFPGRYSPHFCVRYTPHTYTNLLFSVPTAVWIQHRAVENKYVSRLWLTLRQAAELFGTHLFPERANGNPVLYCNHFTVGVGATAFYCADQFAGGDAVFPSARPLDIVVKSVSLASTNLRGFPLLARCIREEMTNGTGGVTDLAPIRPHAMPADTRRCSSTVSDVRPSDCI
ncbi:hypothetical protein IOCL2690_000544800 [Leishmania lindenbergi]|uniref:Uncharacterized protein n=1 Tax=Leishmania lindenbergi TaxID=651832 RepID=A0AAW3AA31_9TRYP